MNEEHFNMLLLLQLFVLNSTTAVERTIFSSFRRYLNAVTFSVFSVICEKF